jgi:hypothetical protein
MKCEHNKDKYNCKECGGKGICEHSKQKYHCKECNGKAFCEHDKRKDRCKECNGKSLCEHDKRRTDCKECGGSQICEHNIRKSICKKCDGSAYCEHKRIKYRCKQCNGNTICEHNNYKYRCIICSPYSNCFCKECRIFIVTKKQNYLCNYCNKNKPNRIKTKELKLKTFLEENQYTFEYNKYCTYQNIGYYPDFKIKCNNFWIIIECDEFAHKDYEKEDEKERENNICLGLGLPCVFLRYNPDKKGIKTFIKQKVLKSYIEYYKNKEKYENEVCYLFY